MTHPGSAPRVLGVRVRGTGLTRQTQGSARRIRIPSSRVVAAFFPEAAAPTPARSHPTGNARPTAEVKA